MDDEHHALGNVLIAQFSNLENFLSIFAMIFFKVYNGNHQVFAKMTEVLLVLNAKFTQIQFLG